MKALILSVRPEHAIKILEGEKTLELRKSVPKDYKGWVYVYVTKGKPNYYTVTVQHNGGQAILGFTKEELGLTYKHNGQIPFRFWFDEWEEVLTQHHIDSEQIERILKQACIEPEDLDKYVGDKETIYAWHIKQLDIFYYPMWLSDFIVGLNYLGDIIPPTYKKLTKAPQSYQYVWVAK